MMVGKNPTSYRLRSGGAHESHNIYGGGGNGTEEKRLWEKVLSQACGIEGVGTASGLEHPVL